MKQPTPKTDGLRAMREAAYEAEQARQKAERAAAKNKPKPDIEALRAAAAAIPVKKQRKEKKRG